MQDMPGQAVVGRGRAAGALHPVLRRAAGGHRGQRGQRQQEEPGLERAEDRGGDHQLQPEPGELEQGLQVGPHLLDLLAHQRDEVGELRAVEVLDPG